jgi:adenosylcobinamide amidohydrolase
MSADLVRPPTGSAPQNGPERPRMPAIEPEQAFRIEAGRPWPVHLWRFDHPRRAICSGPYGGGIGERSWVVNATVPRDYARLDPDVHVAELAADLGLTGPGAGMLTAVDVRDAVITTDGGVGVVATVGLGQPTLAATLADPTPDPTPVSNPGPEDRIGPDATTAPDAGTPAAYRERGTSPGGVGTGAIGTGGGGTGDTGTGGGRIGQVRLGPVGTINIVAFLPVPLADAALVNGVMTATEAKVQALVDCGLAATGTATDAVVLTCPVPIPGEAVEPYGGPRSTWGARLARAVYAAVEQGARRWLAARSRD